MSPKALFEKFDKSSIAIIERTPKIIEERERENDGLKASAFKIRKKYIFEMMIIIFSNLTINHIYIYIG